MSADSDIRAVSFDVGGTLIEPWPSVGHVYAEIAAQFGITGIAPEALNRQFATAWKSRVAFDYSRDAWRDLVNHSFAGLCPTPPSRDCFDAMYDGFATVKPWRLFDDVISTLDAVKARGWKLAILSNWDERLRPLLVELELMDRFDAVVISHEAGCTKPAPEIFHRAAAELGLPAAAVLHIGDSRKEDVSGAQAAGMKALLLDRRSDRADETSVNSLAAVLRV
jgi:putative hydrolase of the HAD superfamily